MKRLGRLGLWYLLLTKRLLKRPVFPILLLCVVLLGGAAALLSRQENGVVTAALVWDDADPVASAAAERLLSTDSVVRCVPYGTEAAARAAVARGDADAAWILGKDLGQRYRRFVAGEFAPGDRAVLVVEREDNVFLRLARERLGAALYPELSRALVRDFLETDLAAGSIPDDVLENYYAAAATDAPILVFASADGTERSGELLTAPLRGLLALLAALAALSSALYCYRDDAAGTFLGLSRTARRALPLLCHFAAAVPVGLASLIALWAAGLLTAPGRELGLALLYCAAVSAFAELLRRLCRGEALLAALLPALLAAMLALCPVFADLAALRPAAHLFPPYYYLNAVPGGGFLWKFAAYTAAASALAVLLPPKIE